MAAAPWLAIRCLQKRRSRAPFDHLGARKDGDAHRESSGGERGVQEGLEGAVRRRRRLEREREGAVRANPRKPRPKCEFDDT